MLAWNYLFVLVQRRQTLHFAKFFVLETVDEALDSLGFLDLQGNVVGLRQHVSDCVDVVATNSLQELSFLVLVVNTEPCIFEDLRHIEYFIAGRTNVRIDLQQSSDDAIQILRILLRQSLVDASGDFFEQSFHIFRPKWRFQRDELIQHASK